jgi:urease accessory protein
LQASTTLKRPDGTLLWTERALLDASDPIREARQGLGGWNAFGTLWAVPATGRIAESAGNTANVAAAIMASGLGSAAQVAPDAEIALADPVAALMDALNALLAFDHLAGEHGICAGATRLPNGVILIRAVARRMETLQACLIQCWELLRPAIHGVAPLPLRLWTT